MLLTVIGIMISLKIGGLIDTEWATIIILLIATTGLSFIFRLVKSYSKKKRLEKLIKDVDEDKELSETEKGQLLIFSILSAMFLEG